MISIFSFSLLFVAVYLASGIIPAMALSELKEAKKYIFVLLKVAFSLTLYLILLAFTGYLISSIVVVLFLLLFFTTMLEKNYVYLLPVLLAFTIISNIYEVMILAVITMFLQGMLDYERGKQGWHSKYVKNSAYFFLLTLVLSVIFYFFNS